MAVSGFRSARWCGWLALCALVLAGCTAGSSATASPDTGSKSSGSHLADLATAATAPTLSPRVSPTVSATTDSRSAPRATTAGPVDIGAGRHLYLTCQGSGFPTVLLESGYHDSSSLWSEAEPLTPSRGPAVMPALAATHKVCAYDRPGTLNYETNPPSLSTRSSPVKMPRTVGDINADLLALINAAHLGPKVILVGHSLGGLMSIGFARSHPEKVAALVLVDAFAPDIPAQFGADWPTYRAVLDHPGTTFDNDPSFERVDIDASLTAMAKLPALPAIPLVVLSKTQPFPLPAGTPAAVAKRLEPIWAAGQDGLVALRPNTPHLIATGSDHYIQVRQPDLVAAAVNLAAHRLTSP